MQDFTRWTSKWRNHWHFGGKNGTQTCYLILIPKEQDLSLQFWFLVKTFTRQQTWTWHLSIYRSAWTTLSSKGFSKFSYYSDDWFKWMPHICTCGPLTSSYSFGTKGFFSAYSWSISFYHHIVLVVIVSASALSLVYLHFFLHWEDAHITCIPVSKRSWNIEYLCDAKWNIEGHLMKCLTNLYVEFRAIMHILENLLVEVR